MTATAETPDVHQGGEKPQVVYLAQETARGHTKEQSTAMRHDVDEP